MKKRILRFSMMGMLPTYCLQRKILFWWFTIEECDDYDPSSFLLNHKELPVVSQIGYL